MDESTGLLSQRSVVLGTSQELPSPLEPMLESVFTSLRQRSFLLLHFIFRCLIPLIHLHFVRGMPSSDGRALSLILPHVCTCWLVKIYQSSSKLISVIHSYRWYVGQKRVFSVTRSRVWSSECQIMLAGHEDVFNKFSFQDFHH